MPTPFDEVVFGGGDADRPARLPDPTPETPGVGSAGRHAGRTGDWTEAEAATGAAGAGEASATTTDAPTPTTSRKPRKWRTPMVLAGLVVGTLIVNAPNNLLPSRPLVQRMHEQLSPGTPEARPHNAVEAAFRGAMKEAVSGLTAVGKRPAESLVQLTLCSFSPDALVRTQKKMESHLYRYALSSARADLLARCGDTPGLIRLHQELGAIEYPGGGVPVEFLALRERVARTLANSPGQEDRKGRWLRDAESAKAERLAKPLRAARDIEREALDAWHLRDSFNSEMAHAHDRFGRGSRESHGFAMLMRPTVQASKTLKAQTVKPR